jgi:hypothetical protein
MRWLAGVACLCVAGLAAERAWPQTQGVQLKLVDHEGLKQEILKNRGKVLVVDFWGEF